MVAITIPGTLTYYIWVSYMAPYAASATGIPLNQAFLATTIAIFGGTAPTSPPT